MTSAVDLITDRRSMLDAPSAPGALAPAQDMLFAVSWVASPFSGSSAGQIGAPVTLDLMSSSWTRPEPILVYVAPTPIAEENEGAAEVASPARLLAEVRNDSGLTWDQLARYFGVSRRAVHLWVAGGHMSGANEELLAHLVRAVDAVRSLPLTARRQALLRPENGLNIVDAERARRSSRASDINRSPDIELTADRR